MQTGAEGAHRAGDGNTILKAGRNDGAIVARHRRGLEGRVGSRVAPRGDASKIRRAGEPRAATGVRYEIGRHSRSQPGARRCNFATGLDIPFAQNGMII